MTDTNQQRPPAGTTTVLVLFPVSLSLITAALLLVIGVTSIVSMVFKIGPFW